MERTEGMPHIGFHAGSFSARDETRAAAEAARRRVRIMSATLYPTVPHPEPVAAPAARLALRTDGPSRGLLDGAWWPRSRDLVGELPLLTDVLDPLWGRITRIAVNPKYWPVIPRRVPVGGHVVRVGWFTPEIDPHKLLLLSYGTGRWDLLIIPPETGAESAARLMAAASDQDGPPLTASALIAAEAARHGVAAAEEPLEPDEAWEYEGGASAAFTAVPRQPDRAGLPSRLIVGM
ncbi:MAG: hypothetical protein JF597_00460 [Streptomyces sp.]|uniref:DUF5994 family protein n=1 Tax=unclassified Streptomyces TaxID=2593676 RepID=UPI0025DF595A|nr:DUF5994 family protein [Streptomyces sp.]MBW8792114.1 hypothetical protein [Streptomyces sp.]